MRQSAQLRRALLEITERFTGYSVGAQLVAVENLKRTHPHRIRAIRSVDLNNVRTWRFNCHAFTFGLWKHELFWQLRESHPKAWPDGTFVIDHLLPQMSAVAPRDWREGAVVLYYEGDRLKHSGLRQGRLVHSKWGDCHTWEHGLLEVPLSYGQRVLYYEAPTAQLVISAYVQFARQRPNSGCTRLWPGVDGAD